MCALPNSSPRFRQICFVNLEADEFSYATFLRCDGRISDAQKRIEHGLHTLDAMKLDAPLCQLDWKGRRMRSLLFAPLNCFVGNEPGISAATSVAPSRVRPSRDVCFVPIRNAKGEPVEWCFSLGREMKQIFVAIIQETARIDGFEMSARSDFATFPFEADRLDPVNGILQNNHVA